MNIKDFDYEICVFDDIFVKCAFNKVENRDATYNEYKFLNDNIREILKSLNADSET